MQTLHELDDLPLRMVVELKEAFTAEHAERIFHKWRDLGYMVPAVNRNDVWRDAIMRFSK